MNQTAAVIINIASNWSDITQLLHSARTGGLQSGVANVSHTVFQIFPADTDAGRSLSNCHFEAVSRWALDVLLTQYEITKANKAAEIYRVTSGTIFTASLRGTVFERQVLNHFCHIRTECKFSIRRLTGFRNPEWTYRGPIRNFTFEKETVNNAITEAVQNKEPLHLIPSVSNFAAADSILYDPNDPNAVVTCIQVARNNNHPISLSGLQDIQRWFELGTPLKDLRPNKKRPWRFVFVVPFGLAREFKPQGFKGDAGGEAWDGKVHQCVLELEDGKIFRGVTDSSDESATTS